MVDNVNNVNENMANNGPRVYKELSMIHTSGEKMGEAFDIKSKASKLSKLAEQNNGIYLKGFGNGVISSNENGVVTVSLKGRNGSMKVNVNQNIKIGSIDETKREKALTVIEKATGMEKAEVSAILDKIVGEKGQISYKALSDSEKEALGENLEVIQSTMRSVGGVKETLSFNAGNNFYINAVPLKMSPKNDKITVNPEHVFNETYMDGDEEKTIQRVFVKNIKTEDGFKMESVADPKDASDDGFKREIFTRGLTNEEEPQIVWNSVGRIYTKNSSTVETPVDEKVETEDNLHEEDISVEDIPF